MLKRVVASVAVAVMLVGAALAGPWEDGVAPYRRGDYATALRVWQPLAERGDPRAENNLGVLYEKGLGVSADIKRAADWYRSAAAGTSIQRLANWIIVTEARNGNGGRFALPYDKGTLASRLGMTPENLSRSFGLLCRTRRRRPP